MWHLSCRRTHLSAKETTRRKLLDELDGLDVWFYYRLVVQRYWEESFVSRVDREGKDVKRSSD